MCSGRLFAVQAVAGQGKRGFSAVLADASHLDADNRIELVPGNNHARGDTLIFNRGHDFRIHLGIGAGRVFEAPPLRDLPVAWPRGGGWIQRGELQQGDLCLLIVSDRELGPQLLGPNGQPVDGLSRRMHELSDGIVVPLGLSVPGAVIAPSGGRPLIGREDGSVGIRFSLDDLEVEAPAIKLGAGAQLDAARKTDKVGADTAMATHLPAAQLVLTGAATLLGLAVPPVATDFGVITGGSSKVKIQ